MKRRQLLKLIGLGALSPVAFPSSATALFSSSSSPPLTPNIPHSLDAEARVVLIACGSAGLEFCRSINKKKFNLEKIIAIDSSPHALHLVSNADYKFLVQKAHEGWPASSAEIEQAIRKLSNEVKEALGFPDAVILASGIGGSTGTICLPILAELAKQQGARVFCFATQPFGFENRLRHEVAQKGIIRLREATDGLLVVSDIPDRTISNEHSLATAVTERNVALENYLWHICGGINLCGLVGFDLEDVSLILGQSRSGFISRIGWGETSGADRAIIATSAALKHPFLAKSWEAAPQLISVSIRAQENLLKMREITNAINAIKSIADEHYSLLFSANYDDSLGDRFQISIAAS